MLQGKNAVITGCNRGIGKACMEVFARQGANLWVCVREKNSEFLEYVDFLRESCQVECTPLFFDLLDTQAMKEAYMTIKKEKKPVDILVNNAGAVHSALYRMTDEKSVREMNDINLIGGMNLTQYILKIMSRQRSGAIVNLASSGGIDCNAGRVAYNISKAAVIAATKTLAKEVGTLGIRVNAVAPGLTKTDMALNHTPKELMDDTLMHTALGRMGEPKEIANVIAFLASDYASYVTGQVWRVDGGM